jgi:hypothetical protein
LMDKMKPITPEEMAWTQAQPVHGKPDLTRLRSALEADGSRVVELALSDDHEFISFRLERGETVRGQDKEHCLRGLIQAFRSAGFNVGFSEVCVADLDDRFLRGASLTSPVVRVCEGGPVPVGP